MSKKYVCDICNRPIDDPYTFNLKEFYVGCEYILGAVFPDNSKRFRRIHICNGCVNDFVRYVNERDSI